MHDDFSFEAVAESLFTEPTGIVYHYTSLGSFMAIVRSGEMYATDIRYMNDAAELTHALSLVQEARDQRLLATDTVVAAGGNASVMLDATLPSMLLYELDEQLRESSCYVTCFTQNGNQLSQWRGYCPPHKGISIGFHAEDLRECAEDQGFVLRECVYDAERQKLIGDQLLNVLKSLPEPHDATRLTDTYSAFQQIAAVIKHPRFAEERECRLISVDWRQGSPADDAEHREGKSMVIPFRRFTLPRDNRNRLRIAKVIVGPTHHTRQAVASVRHFLSVEGALPFRTVEYCDIPLREA